MTNYFELDLYSLNPSLVARLNTKVFALTLVLMWKLQNPGRALPKWLAGMTDLSSKF